MPVQELAFSENCAMFPARHQPSPYNMNSLGAFPGYGSPQGQGQFPQDYSQYPGVVDPALQQQGVSTSSTCSSGWPGYYQTPSGTMSTPGSRGPVDEFSAMFNTQGQNGAGMYGYHPRGMGPGMQSDFGAGSPTIGSHAGMGHSPLGGSPSPTGMSGMVGMPGAQNSAVASRQQAARPYDWLKKQTYPSAPSSGTCMYTFFIFFIF